MKTSSLANIALLLTALLFGFGVCELVARLVTTVNEDGQAFYGERPLLPYRFPAEMVRERMEYYLRLRDEAYVVDHPLFGWTVGPNRVNIEGMYRSNSDGIRSRPYDYPRQPPEGVLRIALFGDSFTHGDEVHFDSTWGKLLEDDLNREGVSAEVLNFGVPGYGVGQAYLRWKHQGRDYSPEIAVFGFQPENIKRTVNIFRSLYSRRTGLVFSKPRFFIDSAGGLDLVNFPVIPPEEVADTLKNLIRSPLAEYEYWYVPENYRPSFRLRSRFIALLWTLFGEDRPRPGGRSDFRPGRHYWDEEGEPMETSLRILQRFARAAAAAGQIPVILHIPKRADISALERGATPAHYRVLNELEREGVPVVDPAPGMLGRSGLFKHSHYSRRGGEIVARVLAGAIVELIEGEGLRDAFQGDVPSRETPDFAEIAMERYQGEEEILVDLGTAGDRYFIEEGFHGRERLHGRTPVRWTDETAVIRLPFFPGPGSRPVIGFRVAATGPARPGDFSAEVEFGGKLLAGRLLEAGEGTYELELEVPQGPPGLARLTFNSPPWAPGEESGVRNDRRLGLMLDWVKLEYR